MTRLKLKNIISFISITLILAGLYFAVGSYIGYSRSVEVCQNYKCTTQPIFPTVPIFIGSVMIIIGIAAIIARNRLKEFINYKRKIKIVLSLILIFVVSWLHLAITQPCKYSVGFRCDYSVGFPIYFWIVTDYVHPFMLIGFLIGISLNFVIWYIFLSLIFYTIQKVAFKH